MSGLATAIVVTGAVSAYMSDKASKRATEAVGEATETAAEGGQAALDYLKEVERVPRQYRESAMQMLSAEFGIGLPSGPPSTTVDYSRRFTDADGQAIPQDVAPLSLTDQRKQPGFSTDKPVSPSGAQFSDEFTLTPYIEEQRQIADQRAVAPTSITERAMASPLYRSLMDTIESSRVDLSGESIRQEGEEAILRHQSMTGGFRSGNTQSNLARFNMGLEERLTSARNEEERRIQAAKSEALLSAYNQQMQGLQGFSGLPSYAGDIAGLQTGIAATQSQGQIAQAQIEQQGAQNIGGAITGTVGNLLLLPGSSTSPPPPTINTPTPTPTSILI